MTIKLASDRYPLAPMQLGMLFHYLSADDPGVDLEQIICTLDEKLDLDAFQHAWEDVANHHPVFRTQIEWEGIDEPVQEVLERVELPFAVIDYQDYDPDGRQLKLKSFLREDRCRGFDLRSAPLMRVTVLQMAENQFVVVWTVDHIILDGRSFVIVLKEVFERYDALCNQQTFEPENARPYKDHIEHLQQIDLSGNEARSFWSNYLKDFTSPTPLPGAAQTPIELADGDDDLGEKEIRLSETTTRRLQEVTRQHGVSMNNLVQGAWAILLNRYGGGQDVVFGAARAGRRSSVEGAEKIVGHFINTVPVRVNINSMQAIGAWLNDIRAAQSEIWKYEQTPLVDVQGWSEVPTGMPLFESLLVFDNFSLDSFLRNQGGDWSNRHFKLSENTGFPLTLYANMDTEMFLRVAYDCRQFTDQIADQLLQHLVRILDEIGTDSEQKLGELKMLSDDERNKILIEWNDTVTDFVEDTCIHHLMEARAGQTPDAIALSFRDQQLSYADLNAKANQFAHRLTALGVGPDQLVGVCLERSLEMVIAILGILKAGGAYLPLDPAFPKQRIRHMVDDSGTQVIVTQSSLFDEILETANDDNAKIICIDSEWPAISKESETNPETAVDPSHLAYVIYTSGSTGKPKGVMVEHRNVANFFTGMDDRIQHDPPGVWLSVTSLSFDISVLELLYTLARGFKVVLYGELDRRAEPVGIARPQTSKTMKFGLFYFASDEAERTADKYKLLIEGAKFADRNGFTSVSIPERHFHAFGGLYPNPAVAGAGLATITENVQIRSGSVVLPLHHPVRVAEEWSLVDNLSNGRVGISFASGWQPVDFVIRPENYNDRHKIMYENIEIVRELWRGGKVAFPDANGQEHEIGTLPRPVQNELPFWVTTAGNPETWRSAGSIGANVLTHLLGQSVEDIKEKIALYRQARAEAGHDPDTGLVTLMLHTFVGQEMDFVRDTVRQPMKNYLASALNLVKDVAHAWTAFKRRDDGTIQSAADVDLKSLSEEEMDDLMEFSFERYFETSGLFGTPESCVAMVDELTLAGVDEIACLIDFGIDSETVLAHFEYLEKLRKLISEPPAMSSIEDDSVGGLIRKHGVTHLQCTPSMASMFLHDEETRKALSQVQTLMIGGEAFPVAQARELASITDADIINMYGPTETTIWSSTAAVSGDEKTIPIGRPIANTQFYILDPGLEPVPVGVPGELYIGGAGVVRGYYHRDELTAERFIKNPFVEGGEARIYNTGDIARWRPDGSVDFLGRADHQVKIRGYRIELGEIETQLTGHESVREAVVIARQDASGDVRLIAYVIPANGMTTDADSLRKHLREKLPEYMIPARYIEMETFPFTPNNKIDRNALPAIEESASSLQQKPEASPTNEIEKTILGIWHEVLGTPSAGIEDNFFDLGGHSLLAVQAHRKLSEVIENKITIVDLFRYPTVKALAAFIGDKEDGENLSKSEDRGQARRKIMANRRQTRGRRSKSD